MRYRIKLALRNLWRNRRRTVLTFIALSIGILGLIEVDSMVTGLDNEAIGNLIRLETGHVHIHPPGYFDDRENLPIDKTLPTHAVLKAIQGVAGVEGAAPRLLFGARLNTGWEEIPVIAVGIDPSRDDHVFDLGEYVQGRLPVAGQYEAVVGSGLARLLELEPGAGFTLVTRTRSEAFQAVDLTVVGIANAPHPDINNNQVIIPLDVAGDVVELPGSVTEVDLRLKQGMAERDAAVSVAKVLAQRGMKADVLTWREVAQDFLAVSRTERSVDSLFLMLIMLIGAVGIVNTILLGAMERTREIGIMKALGMNENHIVQIFMFEAMGIGILGSTVGALMGIAANFYMVNYGIDLSGYMGDMDMGYPISSVMHGAWNWAVIAGAFVFGILVSLVASYWPARRAAKQDPVYLLRRG